MREVSRRQLKMSGELKKVASDFFAREASSHTLITVTDVDIAPSLSDCTIYITTIPVSKQALALDFAKRMRTELRTEIKKKMYLRSLPFVEVKIDEGERNRQRIEEILNEEKLAGKLNTDLL